MEVCYSCVEEKSNEVGKPLVCDCSCRGELGFVHLSCSTTYTEQRSKQAADHETCQLLLSHGHNVLTASNHIINVNDPLIGHLTLFHSQRQQTAPIRANMIG